MPEVLLMSQNAELDNFVKKAKEGDSEAIVALFDAHAPALYRYALTIVKSEDIADDVLSEAFMRAWTHLPSFKGDNFKAFLYTIARNYAYDILRREKRQVALVEEPVDTGTQNDVVKCCIDKENAEKLLEAVHVLPNKYREVITLRYMDELSVRETAKIMGITDISVRVTQHRALKKLQKILS